MSTVSVYNRSLLLDMVTSDTEYQHDLSTNSALSNTSMSKKGSRRVPRSFQSRSIHKKDRKKTRKPGQSMSKEDLEVLKRSRLTLVRLWAHPDKLYLNSFMVQNTIGLYENASEDVKFIKL